jgi:hypothetical protein
MPSGIFHPGRFISIIHRRAFPTAAMNSGKDQIARFESWLDRQVAHTWLAHPWDEP